MPLRSSRTPTLNHLIPVKPQATEVGVEDEGVVVEGAGEAEVAARLGRREGNGRRRKERKMG